MKLPKGPRKLNKWRTDEGLTFLKLGEKFGVRERTAAGWCRGEWLPPRDRIEQIEKVTGGEVVAMDWYR